MSVWFKVIWIDYNVKTLIHKILDVFTSLNYIYNKLKFNLSVTEKELTQTFVRVTCLCKILKYIKDKVTKKTFYFIYEFADNNNNIFKNKNNFNFLNLLSLNF